MILLGINDSEIEIYMPIFYCKIVLLNDAKHHDFTKTL